MAERLQRSIRPAKSGQVIASFWPIGVHGVPCSVTKYGLSVATVIQDTEASIVRVRKVHLIAKRGSREVPGRRYEHPSSNSVPHSPPLWRLPTEVIGFDKGKCSIRSGRYGVQLSLTDRRPFH